MPDYQKMYAQLFNAITDALEKMETGNWLAAHELLCAAQAKTEEMYIEADDPGCQ